MGMIVTREIWIAIAFMCGVAAGILFVMYLLTY
jgi:hypothetical protein